MQTVNQCPECPAGRFTYKPGLLNCESCDADSDLICFHDDKWVPKPAFLGRFDVDVKNFQRTVEPTVWSPINNVYGVGFTISDYPGANKIRGCIVYTQSPTGKGYLDMRLRQSSSKTAYFVDRHQTIAVYSKSIIYHECGPWHSLNGVHCGYIYGKECRVEVQHSAKVSLQVFGVTFEVATDSFPQKIPAGLFNLAVEWKSGIPTTWVKINKNRHFGISLDDYAASKGNGKLYVRACLTFADSSKDEGHVHVRVRSYDGKKTFLNDNFGRTYSSSKLTHHECGAWVEASTITCLYGWPTSCSVEMMHTGGVNVVIYDYDIEVATSSTIKVPTYMGRFEVSANYQGTPSSVAWTTISKNDGLGFTWTDYPDATKFRLCTSFTDSSTGKGDLSVRLRLAHGPSVTGKNDGHATNLQACTGECDSDKQCAPGLKCFQRTHGEPIPGCSNENRYGKDWDYCYDPKSVFVSDNFGNTWSNSGLVHHNCGAWHSVADITCGYFKENACLIDVKHSQGVGLIIYGIDIELMSEITSCPSSNILETAKDPHVMGTAKDSGQVTKCSKKMHIGSVVTCNGPKVTWGSHTGVPHKHGSNNYDTYCKSLGFGSFVPGSDKYGTVTCSKGALFWCKGYDFSQGWHWWVLCVRLCAMKLCVFYCTVLLPLHGMTFFLILGVIGAMVNGRVMAWIMRARQTTR